MQLKHATVLAALLASAGASIAADQVVIGLITKTETNPFFVKMKEGAAAAAQANGAKLLSGAGKTDGDNAGQVTAIENMMAAGADRKSTRLNSSHRCISYAVFCLKKKKRPTASPRRAPS